MGSLFAPIPRTSWHVASATRWHTSSLLKLYVSTRINVTQRLPLHSHTVVFRFTWCRQPDLWGAARLGSGRPLSGPVPRHEAGSWKYVLRAPSMLADLSEDCTRLINMHLRMPIEVLYDDTLAPFSPRPALFSLCRYHPSAILVTLPRLRLHYSQ